jgi:hypothetical protein
MKRLALTSVVLVLLLGGATVAATSAAGAQTPQNFHADIATSYGFATGDCCFDWFYGASTPVNLPHVGPATLSTIFVQCHSTYACSAPNSELTMTFVAKNGGTLVLHGGAPNVGTFTLNGTSFEISVDGTWTVDPSSMGRFATFVGSGTFSFVLDGAFDVVGGPEHITLDGTLAKT